MDLMPILLSIEILKLMAPESGVLVLRRGQYSHKVKMYKISQINFLYAPTSMWKLNAK